MIIGLTGTNGAGKDTVADYFKEKGFAYFSLSDEVRAECDLRGLPKDRDTMQRVANEMRGNLGADILAKMVLEKIHLGNIKNALVVSIRNPHEVEAFKAFGNFIMLAVDAPAELRYQRISSRGRTDDAVTFEKFVSQEEFERHGSPTGQQLDAVIKMANHVLINDGTREELYQKVEKILS
jgi:dephospho-CoA kinase